MKTQHHILSNLPKCGRISNGLSLLILTSLVFTANLSAQGLLEEIIVTAQKREQNLQEVPIAISVMDETAIEQRGLSAIEDLVYQVPTLQFSAFGSLAAVSLRGVSYENTTPGGDPGVAMHTDGVYLGRPVAGVFDFWDMERMEVLRGPQGTLYGRNATGGSINFISKRPSDEKEGKIDFTYGNYDRYRVRGMVNVPLSDSVKARVSASWEDRDGYQKNLFPGGVEFGGASSTPTPLTNDLVPHLVTKDGVESNDQQLTSVSATLTWDFGGMTFKSITAYAETSFTMESDTDESGRPIMHSIFSEDQEQFSQEVQLTSTGDGPLQWLVGAFFFTEEADRRSTLCNDDFQAFTLSPLATGFAGDCPGNSTVSPTGEQGFSVGGSIDATSYAVFAQLDYDLTERITATAGARFSWDEKDAVLNQFTPFAPVGNFIPSSPPLVLVPGLGPVPFMGPLTPVITNNFTATRKQNWSEPTWKFNINWAATDDINLYALYSRGYKSGGANLNGATIADAFYDPEFIDSYEVGAKMRLWDRLQLNISAYHNDVDALQLQVFGNGGVVLANAASADIEGLEIESTFAVTDSFTVNGSLGLLDAEYSNFMQAVGPGVAIDRSGNKLNRAPSATVNLGGSYSWEMGSIGSFVLRADYHWQDEQFFQPDNVRPIHSPSYENLDIRGFWYSSDEKWTVEAYATNLTDETQVGDVLRAVPFLYGGLDLSSYKAPQMYGIRLGYSFF